MADNAALLARIQASTPKEDSPRTSPAHSQAARAGGSPTYKPTQLLHTFDDAGGMSSRQSPPVSPSPAKVSHWTRPAAAKAQPSPVHAKQLWGNARGATLTKPSPADKFADVVAQVMPPSANAFANQWSHGGPGTDKTAARRTGLSESRRATSHTHEERASVSRESQAGAAAVLAKNGMEMKLLFGGAEHTGQIGAHEQAKHAHAHDMMHAVGAGAKELMHADVLAHATAARGTRAASASDVRTRMLHTADGTAVYQMSPRKGDSRMR